MADAATRRKTERLLLRGWSENDLDDLVRICSDPEVMRYIGPVGGPKTVGQSEALLDSFREHRAEYGFGLWAATLKDAPDRVIGWIGLARPLWLPEVAEEVEVGWVLDRPQWGRGLATEGAREALRVGFEDLGLQRIISIAWPDNVASLRVMDKLEIRHDRDTIHPMSGITLRIHTIAREAWERSRRGPESPAPRRR